MARLKGVTCSDLVRHCVHHPELSPKLQRAANPASLRAWSEIAQKETKATKNGRTFVAFVAFCWDVFKVARNSLWSNEKAQVRPTRLRETKRSRANWHGSKASPAAIWLGGVIMLPSRTLQIPSGIQKTKPRNIDVLPQQAAPS